MSGHLLDTNVLIDAARGVPAVKRWLTGQDDARLFTATLVVGELHRGFRRRGDAAGDRWLAQVLLPEMAERILPFDAETAILWGRLMADAAAAGRRPPADDAKLAATALLHGLVLVTRNTADFAQLGVRLLDPHAAAPSP